MLTVANSRHKFRQVPITYHLVSPPPCYHQTYYRTVVQPQEMSVHYHLPILVYISLKFHAQYTYAGTHVAIAT